MTVLFTAYLKKLGLLMGFLALLYLAAQNLFPGMVTTSKALATFVVVFVVTAGGHFLLLKAPDDKQKMIVFTLLSIVLKLIAYGLYAVLLIVSDKTMAIPNITLFFSLYLCITVFDIYQQRSAQKTGKSGQKS